MESEIKLQATAMLYRASSRGVWRADVRRRPRAPFLVSPGGPFRHGECDAPPNIQEATNMFLFPKDDRNMTQRVSVPQGPSPARRVRPCRIFLESTTYLYPVSPE